MWWRRAGIFARYNYYRRYRPWYGYPYRKWCCFSKRLFYTPLFCRPIFWICIGIGLIFLIKII